MHHEAEVLDDPACATEFARVHVGCERDQRAALAHCWWNTIAEPGDGLAGAVVAALGAERSLAALVGAAADSPQGFAKAVIEAPGIGRSDAAAELDGLATAFTRWRSRIDPHRVRSLIHAAFAVGARFITPHDPQWPAALNDLGVHAPLGLWARGDQDALVATSRSVALVGSRASTTYGETVASELACGAVDRGFAVVSGGAYGIDAQSHRATLASGGCTVAVLAGGVDRLYPAGNRELLERIISTGAVISEVPCGAAPTRWRFLQRNRLIAALAAGTVIVEAGARSGAMNTASHAMALGRALGAVPGPITSSASVGCHRLLRDRLAECISSVDDLAALCDAASSLDSPATLFELDAGGSHSERAPESGDLGELATRTLDALAPRAWQSVDELVVRSGMASTELRAGLSELELLGRAACQEGRWRRAS